MMEKWELVLRDREYDDERDQQVFANEDDRFAVAFGTQEWADMLYPSAITVTIDPGDRLN